MKRITKYQKAVKRIVELDAEPAYVGHAQRTEDLIEFVAFVFGKNKEDVDEDVSENAKRRRG